MAIRERKGITTTYQVYWNNPFTGKRESASFTSKEEAEKEDSLIKHRLKFEREYFETKCEVEKPGITLEQVFVLYMQYKQFSAKNLNRQLGSMRRILREYGGMLVNEIDYEQVVKTISQSRRGTKLKETTIFRIMTNVRCMLKWATANGLCEMPVLPKVPRGINESYIPPTPEELQRMLDVAEPHIQRVIIIGAYLGCRVGSSELFRLKWSDVNLLQAIVRIPCAKKNKAVTWREVPIRESLLPIMAQWAIDDKAQGIEYLVHYHGKQVQVIKGAWKNTLKRAGIERNIRPYDLRHAFATELIAAGADIGTVAKLMGHANPMMVYKHYQYVMDKQKRAAVEGLPELLHVPSSCATEKSPLQHSDIQ